MSVQLPPPDWDVTKCRICGAEPDEGCVIEAPDDLRHQGCVDILFCVTCWENVAVPTEQAFTKAIKDDPTFVDKANAAIDAAIMSEKH